MTTGARVHSVEAIEAFRIAFIRYLEQAARALDDVHDEVVRTRLWLQSDRRVFWEEQVRRRTRELEQRQQELLTARLSGLRDSVAAEQRNVKKAEIVLEEGRSKLDAVRSWLRRYDDRVDPLARAVEKLRGVITLDMQKGLLELAEAAAALRAYADLRPPASDHPKSLSHDSASSTS